MGLGKDGRIPGRDLPPSFPVHCQRHYGRPTTGRTVLDKLIDELDDVVGKPNGDLLAHTKMVPEIGITVGCIRSDTHLGVYCGICAQR